MATTSEPIDGNVNKKEDEEKKLDDEQDNKATSKVDDLNQIGKTDKLSSVQSNNEDNKSDPISIKTDNQIEKPNEEKLKVETTTNEEKLKSDNKNDFHIEKGDQQHLTDFQRQKAEYFFKVNLDIENKKHVTWDDVEFYLLFHVTAADKEGSNGGDIEARLSRATRAFWEHVHDQIPLPDGERGTLTLDQFLDTWASLIDYVVEKNQLPPIVQELVKLGFELYSAEDEDGKLTIQPQAFDQLFQKMNLSRPYAVMAYRYLIEVDKKPLDADKIDSIVKAVITSSDDENYSHFLLPGFFKTITNNTNKDQSETKDDNSQTPPPSSTPKAQEEKAPSSPPPQQQKPNEPPSSPKAEQPKGPFSPPPQQQQNQPPLSPKAEQPKGPFSQPSQQQQQQPNQPPPSPKAELPKGPSLPPSSPKAQQQNGISSPPTQEKKPTEPQKQPNIPSQNGVNKPLTSTPLPSSSAQPLPQKPTLQDEDDSIRRLLRYYHIDDGDIVEVADGPLQRVLLVHPERPLPPYIQQNKQLLQKLQPGLVNAPPTQQNGSNNNGKPLQPPPTETKPTVTLEERVSRGEAQKGPTIPSRPEQKKDDSSSTNVRQVYPQLSESQQEEQQKQAKLQATQPANNEKQTKEEPSTANDVSVSSKQDETKQTKGFSSNDEEKIVAAVLKQLGPIVEKRVAAEVRRLQSDNTDEDEDEDENIMPFPFMFGGGGGFPIFATPGGGPRDQQQASGPGIQGGSAFIPPQLLMAMMSNLAQGDMGGEIPSFPLNMQPPPNGPIGVEGFMMFVDDNQLAGGPPGYPPRSGQDF